MNADIDLRNVTLRYGSTTALEGVSCTLKHGVTYGLIGRNGAGKTSLLSLIASFRKPTAGTIRIGGEDPFENADRMPWVQFVYPRDVSEEDDTVEGFASQAPVTIFDEGQPWNGRPFASAMLYGTLAPEDRSTALERGLEVSPVSLQELFIHLTREDNAHAIDRR